MHSAITSEKSIPVVVVEDHNDVLQHLYRAIGSKKLPFEKGTMIHFDSHPDLVIPDNFDASKIFDKEYILNCISIESWILPAVYAKHFSTVAWIKPPWATQLSEGIHNFDMGCHRSTKEVKVSCSEAYFMGDCSWSPKEDLEDSVNVTVEVCTLVKDDCLSKFAANDVMLDTSEYLSHLVKSQGDNLLSPQLLQSLGEKPFVLDIDLDFYSTHNPFLNMYTAEQYDKISQLYHYEHPKDPLDMVSLQEASLKRQKQLSELKQTIKEFKHGGECATSNPELIALLKSIKKDHPTMNLGMVHNTGCTCDDCTLPHHVSTKTEINHLVNATREFLHCLPKPSIITIARSTFDDYCPLEDVDYIQEAVLEMLGNLYGPLNITLNYESMKDEGKNILFDKVAHT